MPKLITKVEGENYDIPNGNISYLTPILGQIQEEDFVGLYGFTAYLQNLTRAEDVSTLRKPVRFGLLNKYNIAITTLEITY